MDVPAEHLLNSKRTDPFWVLSALITLFISVYYIYWHSYPVNFLFTPDGVVYGFVDENHRPGSGGIQIGDRVVAIGTVEFEQAKSQYSDIFADLRKTDSAKLRVRRGAAQEEIEVEVHRRRPLRTWKEHVTALAAMTFWLAATLAIIFLRPRNERRLILILMFLSCTLWIAAGYVSFSLAAFSAVIFRILSWLFLPMSIHLHLIIPEPLLSRHKKTILTVIYASTALSFTAASMLADSKARIIEIAVVLSLAVAISIVIVIFRLLTASTAASRLSSRLMAFGVILGVAPIVISLIPVLSFSSGPPSPHKQLISSLFLAFLPLWPISYIYAIYKHDVGTLRYRANRFLGTYAFWTIYLAIFLLAFDWTLETESLWGMATIFTLIVAAQQVRTRFQLFIDQRIFGIRYSQNELISTLAKKIPVAINRSVLNKFILEDILPVLMIRKSALYLSEEGSDGKRHPNLLDPIYEQNLQNHESDISPSDLKKLLSSAGNYIPANPNRNASDQIIKTSWVRLTILLSVQHQTIGVWFLGKRDPDDYYPKDDIDLLTSLANQIAPVIENFRLVEMARQEVEENRRLQEQLIHSQKMEAIGRFSAGIAHDFNNLLSVILGYSSLLLEKREGSKGLHRGLSEIHQAGKRAADLTRQLLAFSRQSEMERKLTDINNVIRDTVTMINRLVGEDIIVEIDLANNLKIVNLDSGQMSQAIINLAVNARDAMPNGGRLAIHTRNIEVGEERTYTSASGEMIEPGPYVLVTVTDTGTGIDPKIRPHIFEPFYTTKEKDHGTGLGLSMVYGFVRQSNGYISVEGESEIGTTFNIYLPPADEIEQAGTTAPDLESGEDPSGYETILLVEDEDSVRAITAEILESRGYSVLQAHNAHEGLKISTSYNGRIDLLLSDVIMPEMRGPELADRLLQDRPSTKVLFMSGYNEELFDPIGGKNGIALVHKPFSPEKLAHIVRQTLDLGTNPDD